MSVLELNSAGHAPGHDVLGTTSTTPADIRLDVDILVLLAPYGGVPRRVLTF